LHEGREDAGSERPSGFRIGDARYRALFDHLPQPALVCDAISGRIVEMNRAALAMYGYDDEEARRLSTDDLQARGVGDDGIASCDGGRVARHRTKAGAVLFVEMHASDLELDGLHCRLCVAHDVTERVRMEERSREQAALLDAANDSIVVRDLEDRVVYVNAAAERALGRRRAEMLGERFEALFALDPVLAKDAPVPAARPFVTTLAEGAWSGEHVLSDAQGAKRILSTRMSLVRDEGGQARAVLMISTDVTEQRRLEEQYMRAQRMESIGTLAGGIAHDLNNVLAPILMSVDLLRCGDVTPELADTLETIEAAATRGAQMVKQVLSFARGVEGERVKVRPDFVLRDVARIVRDSFPKSVQLAVDVREDVPPVVGDATQLHQVLLNLAVNARDAMPDGGTLTLKAEGVRLDEHYAAMSHDAKPGSYVVLTVADTGAGIEPAAREHLFEPFFTTKEVGKGTGLGLSTALAIVKSHGGFIQVESEPDKGAVFRVYLRAEGGDGEPEEGRSGTDLPRGNGELVLVVDDEPSVLRVTKQTLEAFGYRVLTASDGAEAIAAFAKHEAEISVVMTDINMPIMDGPATVRALRRIDPEVRIIAVSGVHRGASAKTGELDVQRFLAKPYTASTLLSALREIVGADE
jgi:PAS domain S-box-containing protein